MQGHMRVSSESVDASWPYATLFFFGFFGETSPGGRRYSWQSLVAGLMLGISLGALASESAPLFPAVVWATLLPASAIALFAALACYLRGLDELSRSIQLKALAVGYGAAIVLGSGVLGLVLAAPAGTLAGVHPLAWTIPLVGAEIIRCAALVVFARRFG